MSHTNSTTNYNLPQFVGTDKPTWLNDVNGAFAGIDAQMKLNADSATSAGTSATTANNNIGTMSNLETTAKTDLVSAVNEVNTTVGTVSGVASSASATATQANNKATALESAFNMTQFGGSIDDIVTTNVTKGWGWINYATNADGSVGKLYGFLGVWYQNNAGKDGKITIPTTFRPTTDININGMCIAMEVGVANVATDSFVANFPATIKTNGNVEIEIGSYWYNRKVSYYFPPCLYFMKDFGDTPTPTPNA